MATEQTPSDRGSFILLCDFWDAYKNFELKQTTSVPDIDGAIRPQIFAALAAAVDRLETIDLYQLRQKTRDLIPNDSFVVTLDGGIIFNRYDFGIEVTRACTRIGDAHLGPYIRVPRPLAAHLSQQFINLKAAYERSSKSEVVICDDGLGTGDTIKRILSGLKDIKIDVALILTVTNPNDLDEIYGVPVRSLRSAEEPYNWLNERDLYWGLPRSGLSISSSRHFMGLGGIPYTVNNQMVTSRIGIAPDCAERFRQACINANVTFWKMLERFCGRPLTLKDCARLGFFTEIFGDSEEVINVLSIARTSNILDRCSFTL